MRTLVGKELDGEMDEIVAIPSDEAASLLGGPLELLPVRKRFGTVFVDADRIDAPSPE